MFEVSKRVVLLLLWSLSCRPPLRYNEFRGLRSTISASPTEYRGLLDLYFGFSSEAGTWSRADVTGWFREAGLAAQKPRSSRLAPDLVLHIGPRPG